VEHFCASVNLEPSLLDYSRNSLSHRRQMVSGRIKIRRSSFKLGNVRTTNVLYPNQIEA
jgi:hypothetical protein